jgi:serine/threonine protein kinase
MSAEKFSRYELKDELGRGGMAIVYRAYDPLFDRVVALKILNRELLDDSQLRERFERETKIIAKLEHAAIVPVYDVDRDNRQLFFVMRYMSGGSLTERIQSRSLSLSQMAHIIQRVAGALDYAHDRGVIHRDLKPGNILFDEYNNAYISDFGIAKLTQAATQLTNSGIIGTPTHMSPEQAQGEDVDGRSDIYSLGVILFEMLSGKTPYEARTPLGMALKHAAYPVPRILNLNPSLPPDIEAVNEKVMAKERDKRYRSGLEFANAFIAALPEGFTTNVNFLTPQSSPAKTEPQTLLLPPGDETPQRRSLDLG